MTATWFLGSAPMASRVRLRFGSSWSRLMWVRSLRTRELSARGGGTAMYMLPSSLMRPWHDARDPEVANSQQPGSGEPPRLNLRCGTHPAEPLLVARLTLDFGYRNH